MSHVGFSIGEFADVTGGMVELSGPILGESFFSKEIGQALQLLDGMFDFRAEETTAG